jgi:nucleoside-diphosphate-sugar epimerase
MQVLLTGASSFIGSHLANHLLGSGFRVSATFRNRCRAIDVLAARGSSSLTLLPLDLATESDFSQLPRAVDAIIHVAGVSAMPGVTAEQMLECNVTGTRNLLNYATAAGARFLIFLSTLSVHGRILESEVDENTPVRDPDIYGASKFLAERLIAVQSELIPSISIRLPGVLGLGAHRAWVPRVLDQLARNEDVVIYNPDAAFNNAVHVNDLGRLIVSALARGWIGYNAFPIGARGAISIRQVVETLAESCPNSHACIRASTRENTGFTISSNYAIDNFGYAPMEITEMLVEYASHAHI